MVNAWQKLRLAAVGVVTVAACACTPGGVSTVPASTPPSAAALSCSSNPAQALLLSFARSFDAGKGDLVTPYFAAPPQFLRWVDPTLGKDYIGSADYSRLGRHLMDLRRRGIRFRIMGFEGSTVTSESAAGFKFKIPYGGSGIYDCVVRKITLMKWANIADFPAGDADSAPAA